MKLNIKHIIIGILAFMLIVNILILFNLDYFYIRAILAFIFLITIPGLLIMLCFKIRTIGFWEYFVYTIGLSVAFIMFVGLFFNWISIGLQNNNEMESSSIGDYIFYDDCSIEEIELPIAIQNIWVGENNVLYGYYDGQILKSMDKGETWEAIYEFVGGRTNRRIWVDSRNTIFAGRDDIGKMYMGRDGGINWDISLNFACQNATLNNGESEGFGTLWNMDEDSLGNLYVGEYGGIMDATCANIYKSGDGGLTWEIIYNSADYGWGARHVHTVKVDRENDYIYAAQGDGYKRARLIRSTDHGETWETLQSETSEDWSDGIDAQYTTMIFFSDYRLFGTDSHNPNKIVRTSDDLTFLDVVEFIGTEDGYVWSVSKKSDSVAFFGTVSEKAGNNAGLYVTEDKGDSWCKVKDLGETALAYQGVNHISNFDSEGYAYYHNTLNNKVYRFKIDSKKKSNDTSRKINWTLLVLGITDKPLSTIPILIEFDFVLLILMFFAYFRNRDLKFQVTFPKFTWLDRIFMIIPMFFPVLSILGAFILNNNGPNYLTMILFGSIAVYVFMVVIFRNKLNENVYPWAILMISLSLLLVSSLRSWYISGVDTNLEYHIFQIIKEKAYWKVSLFQQAYNACLSVSIFPTILSYLLKINDQYIFKLIIPIIFSITPLVVYLFLRRYTKNVLAFIAIFFFVSQLPFLTGGPSIPIRQEIAILFFALFLSVLFSKQLTPCLKDGMFMIFGFSMIVSHYSTSYVALALFIFTYFILFLYLSLKGKKIKGTDLKSPEPTQVHLSGWLILILLVFAFFWYAQLTNISGGMTEFVSKSIKNIGEIFTDEVRQAGVIDSQWNIFYNPDIGPLLGEYTEEVNLEYKNRSHITTYDPKDYKDYTIRTIYSKFLPIRNNQNIISKIYLSGEIIKKLVKAFMIIGVLFLLFFQIKKRKVNIEYTVLALVGLIGLAAMIMLPYASIDYSLMRAYQQVLVVLALPTVFGGLIIFKFLGKSKSIIAISIIFILYFLFLSGFIPQILGSTDAIMQLNNFGESYNKIYVHRTEITSAAWLIDNYSTEKILYVDNRAETRILLLDYPYKIRSLRDIMPQSISRDSYLYSSHANTVEGITFKSFRGVGLSFNFPKQFLNENKNKVYGDGGSEIFK